MPEPSPPPLLDDDELAAWLRLMASPGLGRDAVRRLLAVFGPPQAVLRAPMAALGQVLSATQVDGLHSLPEGLARRTDAALRWRSAGPKRRVMVLGEPDYPVPLLHTADPPLLLYLEGEAGLLSADAVAIVGSRRPTPQGADNARRFAHQLAARGWVIVSGLAAGIDGAAHEGALDAADEARRSGARVPGTVAVVGTGIDQVYPARHAGLQRRLLAEGGLVVSEFPLGAPPLAGHFPQRNRLIAGLCRGTLVVEAALRSGSLITARLAAEAGREVMVVPGSILAEQSAGGHELIRQGATLVASPEQVLEALGPPPETRRSPPPVPAPAPTPAPVQAVPADAGDDPVLAALGHDPCSLDALVARCGWPAHALSAHLLGLELEGQVARLPGGLYQRVQAA